MRMNAPSNALVTLKRLVDIAWRWKSWLVLTIVLSATTSLVLVGMTTKLYRATTTIIVTGQSVPETLVGSPVTLDVEERLKNLQVQVFSRSYLEQIGREFEIIPVNADESDIERSCVALRERITAEFDRGGFSWFRISVEDVDSDRAAGVANRLATLFIEQNSRMRASQAAGTRGMTEDWEQRYRIELAGRDAAVAEFNRHNLYSLPDQQPANLQLLSSAQFRVAQLTSDIRTRHDRLDALHAQRQAQQAVNDRSEPESTDLASLRNELTALVATYTEENPLVKRTRQRIAELVGSVSNAAAPGDATNSPAAPGLDPMSMEIATIEGDIKALESDREREGNNIASYRSRVGDAPRLQQELLELTRGYDQVKQQFVTAVAQTEQARRAQDLEESKKGEQFQIQDLASPPTTPYKPNTLRYLVAGVGLGLLVGVGTLGARDLVVQTVRGEEEFAAQFPDLPIYGVIPSLASRPGPPDRPYTSSSRIDPRNA